MLQGVALLVYWTVLGSAAGTWCGQMRAGTFGLGWLEETRAPQPTIELVLPPQVHLGDRVMIALRVRNDGSRLLNLELPGRPVAFDVIIRGPDGAEVWRRLRNTITGSALMLLRLKPGQVREFSAQWAQVDNDGRPVAPGSYSVRGVLPAQEGRLTTAVRELIITR
jgi:hypothetical protein